jgi:hypothetical protein
MLTLISLAIFVASPNAITIDTLHWKKKTLSTLGKERFSFQGSILLPPKSKSKTVRTDPIGKRPGDVLAYIDLASGARVMLMERAPNAFRDPTMLAQLLAKTGEVLEVRKNETSYMIFVQQEQGLVIQGANWVMAPGFDCASEKPLTLAQAEEITVICNSLNAK